MGTLFPLLIVAALVVVLSPYRTVDLLELIAAALDSIDARDRETLTREALRLGTSAEGGDALRNCMRTTLISATVSGRSSPPVAFSTRRQRSQLVCHSPIENTASISAP
jgi:hypothetical protein